MTRAPRIGIFGGTFDPVHLGHLIAAADLRAAIGLDAVLFVPAGKPPHKSDAVISEDRHRLAMLELAVAGNPAFRVDPIDMERDGPSYTADLLALLGERLGPADLWFLMGEDSLRDLPTWRTPGRIAELARLGVARRPGIDADLDRVIAEVPGARGRVDLVETPLIGISATDLRARVASGATIAYQVPAAVERYVTEHRLYRPSRRD